LGAWITKRVGLDMKRVNQMERGSKWTKTWTGETNRSRRFIETGRCGEKKILGVKLNEIGYICCIYREGHKVLTSRAS
jgi:hypothetical protein